MSHTPGIRHQCASLLVGALACAGIVIASGAPAEASDPFALYVAPSKVEMLPSDADATQVVIHGVFLQLTAPAATSAPVYTSPKCGKMYFQCPTGKEELCRMQWQDIRKAIGADYCAGFGTLNMVSSARLLDEAARPANPDAWEMGMGVTQAYYLGGQCSQARMSSCTSGEGGAAGGAGAGGDAGGVNGNGAGGSGSGGATSSGGGGGAPAQSGQGGTNDAGVTGPGATVKKPGDGCNVAGTGVAIVDGSVLAFGVALVVGAGRRRTRRRFQARR